MILKEQTMDLPPPIVTQELRIVDDAGHPRIVLSTISGVPTVRLLREDGAPGATLSLDAAGRPAMTLSNPSTEGPTAAIEIDDKGAHVKFDRPGGASSYLFLNNSGGSGVVMLDAKGVRRLETLVDADGTTSFKGLPGTPDTATK